MLRERWSKEHFEKLNDETTILFAILREHYTVKTDRGRWNRK